MSDPKPTEEDPPKGPDLKQLLAKEGDWESVARSLAYKVDEVERDNYQYRSKLRSLKEQVPAEGSRVLTAEQAAELDAFASDLKALGIEDSGTLNAFAETARSNADTVAKAARLQTLTSVAKTVGGSAEAIAAAFVDGEDFETDGEGEAARVFVVTGEDEARKRTPFAEYVDAHKAALKPAIFGASEEPSPPAKPLFPGSRGNGGPPKPTTYDAEASATAKRRSTAYAAAI